MVDQQKRSLSTKKLNICTFPFIDKLVHYNLSLISTFIRLN